MWRKKLAQQERTTCLAASSFCDGRVTVPYLPSSMRHNVDDDDDDDDDDDINNYNWHRHNENK